MIDSQASVRAPIIVPVFLADVINTRPVVAVPDTSLGKVDVHPGLAIVFPALSVGATGAACDNDKRVSMHKLRESCDATFRGRITYVYHREHKGKWA